MNPILKIFFFFLYCQCCFLVKIKCRKPIKIAPIEQKKDIIVSSKKQEPKNNDSIQVNEYQFPKNGKYVEDFVGSSFKLVQEAEGDLNKDGLLDKALVLQNKKDSLGNHPLLILLKQKDHSFVLDKISFQAIPQQYTEDGYKIYHGLDIVIKDGILSVGNIGDGGPYGNINYNFKYFEKNLLLTYVETYNVGAGAWQSTYHEVLKGKYNVEITNTMEENMPVEKKTIKVEKQKIHFQDVDVENFIAKTYQSIEDELPEF